MKASPLRSRHGAITLASDGIVGPEPDDIAAEAAGARPGEPAESAGARVEADAVLGATLETLKRAAHDIEIERHVAETLQRSLLPRLPSLPGLRLAARYRPGSADTAIGGDWYDAIPLRGGKVGVAIGDVVGRGVEAAARMAHLQSALRVYALEALRPAVVLERMNSFVLEGEQGGMVTLLYAIVDPDGCTLHVASAGHPPPLLLDPGGHSTFVESPPGSPLGMTRFPSYQESMTTIDPWSSVMLYTDGLVEGPELPLGEGLDRLRDAMAGKPRDPEALSTTLLEALDARGGFVDDVALLVLQLAPPGKELALALPARPASLASMRRALAQWLRLGGAAEDEVYEVLVACGEACANTVAHAHSAVSDAPFEVRARRERAEVEITVSDTGRWRPASDERRGRGLTLMRELMDDVEIQPGSDGTSVTLRRRLRGDGRW
jgi:serine phosphatase RsbU (regulator of sigma subunit)/anti-sigma regulatory factor (Ser/Thr protein kinase)